MLQDISAPPRLLYSQLPPTPYADCLLIIASQYISETDIQDDSPVHEEGQITCLIFYIRGNEEIIFPIHLINTHNVGGSVQDI